MKEGNDGRNWRGGVTGGGGKRTFRFAVSVRASGTGTWGQQTAAAADALSGWDLLEQECCRQFIQFQLVRCHEMV